MKQNIIPPTQNDPVNSNSKKTEANPMLRKTTNKITNQQKVTPYEINSVDQSTIPNGCLKLSNK